MASKRNGNWSRLGKKRYVQKLHRAQGGTCAGCFRFFNAALLKKVTKPGEANWFELRCKECR